jgi:hypothetical protein
MFWRALVSACNKANIDILMLKNNGDPIQAKEVITIEHGRKKTVLKMGIV